MLESQLIYAPLYIKIFYIGLIPALLTTLGSLPVFLGRRLNEKHIHIGLGFSGGVMVVTSFTSLLIPSLEYGCYLCSYGGILLGALTIYMLDKSLPHLHFVKGYEGPRGGFERYKRMILVVLAIIIHNIPEGMAVGVSIMYNLRDGILVALAIGIQDIPEGLAVSLPYYTVSKNKRNSFIIGLLSGFSELAAAYIPYGIIFLFENILKTLLPFMMSFSVGAMIYVVVHELIPEIYGRGHDDSATAGFFAGFLIMLVLDTILS